MSSSEQFAVQNNAGTGYFPAIPPAGTRRTGLYRRPLERRRTCSKMEFDYLVVTSGPLDTSTRTRLPRLTRPAPASASRTSSSGRVATARTGYPISNSVVPCATVILPYAALRLPVTTPIHLINLSSVVASIRVRRLEPQKKVAYEIGPRSRPIGLICSTYALHRTFETCLGNRIEECGARVRGGIPAFALRSSSTATT